MSNEKYTKEQLEATRVAVLREILASKGGTPLNKPKVQLIKEILDEQDGLSVPERSKKGRRRLSGVVPYAPDGYVPLNFNTPKPELVTQNPSKFDDSYGVEHVGQTETVSGVLDLVKDGYGFLRVNGYFSNPYTDVFVSKEAVESLGLEVGDLVEGIAVRRDGVLALRKIIKLNGNGYEYKKRISFDDLPACYSTEKFNIASSGDVGMKVVDILAPIGKGQRALISAPDKSGKSHILKKIIKEIENNHPEVTIISLLINRRPEEVTEYKNGINSKVVSLSYDESADKQVKACELLLNNAKRLVEDGCDVVIALDDIISLAKSYNYALSAVKTFGGIDVNAVLMAKKFFGSARKVENGGSLTIIATADVNAEQDALVLSELKSVSNMEVELSAQMASRGIYPAIIPSKTYTRNGHSLLSAKDNELAYNLRETDDIREIISLLNS